MPSIFIFFVYLLTSVCASAGEPDAYYVDRDDRTPRLTYRGAFIDYNFQLSRALDGRVVADFDFKAFEHQRLGRLAALTRNLWPQTEVTLEEPVMAIFELHDRVFGILEDLRLVEFRLPQPKLGSGHFINRFYYHGNLSTASGMAALGCFASGQSFVAGALGMFSAIHAVRAFESQRGCDVQLEVYQWSGPRGLPFSVKEVQTQHQNTRFPPVSEVIVQLEGEPPRQLTHLIEAGESECATLLTTQRLKDRPEI